jgi:hypothetical protein
MIAFNDNFTAPDPAHLTLLSHRDDVLRQRSKHFERQRHRILPATSPVTKSPSRCHRQVLGPSIPFVIICSLEKLHPSLDTMQPCHLR